MQCLLPLLDCIEWSRLPLAPVPRFSPVRQAVDDIIARAGTCTRGHVLYSWITPESNNVGNNSTTCKVDAGIRFRQGPCKDVGRDTIETGSAPSFDRGQRFITVFEHGVEPEFRTAACKSLSSRRPRQLQGVANRCCQPYWQRRSRQAPTR